MTNPCKHERIRTWFNLKAPPRRPFKINGQRYKQLTVRPFNGETSPAKTQPNPSWSHGFTHYEVRETGTVGFCGVQYFHDNASPLAPTKAATHKR